jgi:hypothetical protein
MKTKYTINEFNEQFPDDRACLDFIFKARWPDGGKCKCGKADCFYAVDGRRSYACSWCGVQISPTAGTIFHKSETSLKKWFFAMFLMSSSKNGVAAKELERQLGVTYKTAHRMGHKIRQLMQSGGNMMTGVIERTKLSSADFPKICTKENGKCAGLAALAKRLSLEFWSVAATSKPKL